MAQFIAEIRKGNGNTVHRLGHKTGGIAVTINGWNRGILVEAEHKDGVDIFKVYVNGGSHDATPIKLINTVHE
jgi:hypothetical protein